MLDQTDNQIDRHLEKLVNIRNILSQLNPTTVLARGYALIRGVQKVGEVIELETNQTIMKAEVKNVKRK
jgi:exonuclease VII large subunit